MMPPGEPHLAAAVAVPLANPLTQQRGPASWDGRNVTRTRSRRSPATALNLRPHGLFAQWQFGMAALCASRWSAVGCISKRTKPFQGRKARGLLCLPLVGSRLYELHDQEKRLDTGRPSHGSALSRRRPILDPHEPSCDLGPAESAQLNLTSFIIHYLDWEVATGFWGRLSEMGLSVKLTAWRLRRETSQLSLWQLTESSPRPVELKWWDVSACDERRCLPEVQPPKRHCADTNCLFRAPDSTVRHHRVAI